MPQKRWTYAQLAYELSMSQSEVHAGIKRLLAARLAVHDEGSPVRPVRKALMEFLEHGIKYSFLPDRGGMTRGFATSSSAPPLSHEFSRQEEPPPVWPDPEGPVRGYEFSPLYRSVPKAASNDPKLYELLVLVDAIRGGKARERKLAVDKLQNILSDE